MDFLFHHYDALDSTMRMARYLAESDKSVNHIVMADFQTSGKGRIEGRRWMGQAGHSLLMTLVVGGKAGVPALPLRVGLATLEALGCMPRKPGAALRATQLALKWPNDLMGISRERAGKLGGILCEASGDALLAGIGINLTRHAYPVELAANSTSVEETGIIVPDAGSLSGREKLARDIASRVVSRLDDDDWQEAYVKALLAIGRKITFLRGHPSLSDVVTGTMEGIDAAGCLLVKDGFGTVTAYSSGEISGFC